MKKLQTLMVMIFIIIITLFLSRVAQSQPAVKVNFQTFYNELSPYGSWINDVDYGYVWLPEVQSDFTPYGTNGYWINTDYGNTWVSDYSWGWAPFHYGRWVSNEYYGWMWIPGNEWAPAWVAWRSGGGYYGWAPLGPNINISVSFNSFIPQHHWIFAPQHEICDRYVSRHYINGSNVTIINNTTIINNVHSNKRFFTGPTIHEIRRSTGRSVEVYSVNDCDRPGRAIVRSRSIDLYRPEIDHGQGRYAPSHVNTKQYENSSDRYHAESAYEKANYKLYNQKSWSDDGSQQNSKSNYNEEQKWLSDYKRKEQHNRSNATSRSSLPQLESENRFRSNYTTEPALNRTQQVQSTHTKEKVQTVQSELTPQREHRNLNINRSEFQQRTKPKSDNARGNSNLNYRR